MFDRNNCPQCSSSVRSEALKEVGKWLDKQPNLPYTNNATIMVLDEKFYEGIDDLLQGKMPED
jgi:hypothetical protein